jgi:hypothetical protein
MDQASGIDLKRIQAAASAEYKNLQSKENLPPETRPGLSEGRPIAKIAAALSVAQGKFSKIPRDKEVQVRMKAGGTYSFSYAPLETILAAVRVGLKENELCLTQQVVGPKENEMVRTDLLHSSGERLSCDIPILLKEQGPQAYGSALSYARRYGVTLLLCVASDDDDDGNRAEGNEMTSSPPRKQRSDKGSRRIGKPTPEPSTPASTSEYITQGQASNFERSFKDACPPGVNALEEAHTWLEDMGFVDDTNTPTAKRIPASGWLTTKLAAVAYAKTL